jgi:hypothetical protein
LGITAVLANVLYFVIMLFIEARLGATGRIPKRNSRHDPKRPHESFLYFRDRNLFRIGDTVGLSFVAFGVGTALAKEGFPPFWWMVLAFAVAGIVTAQMHKVWLRQPKKDSAYPRDGEASLLGKAHLFYFGGHIFWVLLGVIHVFNSEVLPFTLLALAGGAVWGLAFLSDFLFYFVSILVIST